ncbi:MAG: terminase large subunit [Gemmatimonadales bacterium]|nr:terminase large subunit [Gemmatimonadales bacterium]
MGQPATELILDAWNFSCQDWEERLAEGRSLVPELPLDPAEAGRAVAIFNNLRLPDVPDQPSMADAAGEWFRDIIRAIFGSLQPSGERMVREVFALVPKKNSKTTGGAGIMLTALLMNRRPNAEFLLVGPTQEIADLAFSQASGMIDADPEGFLGKRFHVQEHKKTITDRRTGAFLKVKTFDMKVMTGSKPVAVLVDEEHIIATYSYASRVMRQIRGGMIANPESFLVIITTQSDQPPSGCFKADLTHAREIRDGKRPGGRKLPILYEFPERMQTSPDAPWRNPENWPMVLPNLGRGITLDRLREEYKEAAEKGGDEERIWASQHLNVEIGLAMHADRWRGADYWLAAAEPGLTREAILLRSDVVVVGIDGGGKDDLLGLAVIGRCRTTGRWMLWTKAWCHEEALDRRKDIAEQLRDFEKAAELVIVTAANKRRDLEEVQEIILDIDARGLLPEEGAVGVDTLGMPTMEDALREVGLEAPKVAAVRQGVFLNGVILAMERKLDDGGLVHCGQAVAAWCVGNAKAVLKGSAVTIEKAAAGRAKIDVLVASFNAFSMMARGPKAAGTSVYRERGFLTI